MDRDGVGWKGQAHEDELIEGEAANQRDVGEECKDGYKNENKDR